MSEKADTILISQEVYDLHLHRRLQQTALAEATIYYLVIQLASDKYPAAIMPIDFTRIVRNSPDGRQLIAFPHMSRFLSEDYRGLADTQGVIKDDFVSFESEIELSAPINAKFRKGYILRVEDGVDDIDSESVELVESMNV